MAKKRTFVSGVFFSLVFPVRRVSDGLKTTNLLGGAHPTVFTMKTVDDVLDPWRPGWAFIWQGPPREGLVCLCFTFFSLLRVRLDLPAPAGQSPDTFDVSTLSADHSADVARIGIDDPLCLVDAGDPPA